MGNHTNARSLMLFFAKGIIQNNSTVPRVSSCKFGSHKC